MSGRWSGSVDCGPLVLLPDRPDGPPPGRPVAFLDRDGTLNAAVADPDSGLPESPVRVGDVRLLPGVATAAGNLANAGYALVCATNQPAAAKGKVTVHELLAIHERVIGLLGEQGVRVEMSLLCLHHPDAVVADFSGQCECRKPAPGMLVEAAGAMQFDLGRSWMLGDTDADVGAGRAAGCRTALIEYPASAHKRSDQSNPDLCATDLPDAAAQLLDRGP